jgi:hypothetical protein
MQLFVMAFSQAAMQSEREAYVITVLNAKILALEVRS